jgi:hypothetical protein
MHDGTYSNKDSKVARKRKLVVEERDCMDTLKPILTRYLENNKQLADVNTRAKDLREHRQTLELDLAAAYNESTLPAKIELNASKMVFQVKKPGEWKKGWSLSKKQLQNYLLEILPEHGEDVMKEIMRRHERTLIADEYSFELKALLE